MANTQKAREGARKALAAHVEHVGGTENDETTQIVDLIADLLLTLPDDETAEQVAERAALYASQERFETV